MSQNIIKEVIQFTKDEYEVVKILADVYSISVKEYLSKCIAEAVKLDLEPPSNVIGELGKKLLEQFRAGKNKEIAN